MQLIMSHGEKAREEIRTLGERANALAEEYGASDAEQRRHLFDELAGIVDASTALERQAVELL
jgi:DNA-directed RNA polymerase subunit F